MKKLLLAIAILLIPYTVKAAMPMQPSTQFTPVIIESARAMMSNYPSSATLVLAELNHQETQEITDLINEKDRFYLSIKRNISVDDSNWKLVTTKETFNIWQLHIKSPGAVGIQAFLKNANLIPELMIKIYSGKKSVSSHIEEYSGNRSETSKDFWSTKVVGDTIVIEVWIPWDNDLLPNTFPFTINAINHHFRTESNDFPTLENFSGSRHAQQNACPVVNDLCIFDGVDAYRAISHLLYTKANGSTSSCTGSFLNNSGEELYLLTAFHCISGAPRNRRKGSDINAQIWTSRSPCSTTNDRLVGNDIKFIAANEKADWALLWVNKNTLQRADGLPFRANTPILLGWNGNRFAVGSFLETLHHGGSSAQSYAQSQITALRHAVGDGSIQSDSTLFESCRSLGCTHYGINVLRGGIASGASGSPWWESKDLRDYQVRGVTTNGIDSCTGTISRFDKIYEDGRVQCALDSQSYYPVNRSNCNDSARPLYDNTPPKLTHLSLPVGDLYPNFSSKKTVYIATVADDATQLKLNLNAAEDNQKITINGYTAQVSNTIRLGAGDNTITITVSAADDSVAETYSVKVIRIAEQMFEPVGRWESIAHENVHVACSFLSGDVLDPIGSEYDIVKTSTGLLNLVDNDDSDSFDYTEISRQQPNRYTFHYTEPFTISVNGTQIRGTQSDTVTAILISDERATVVGAGKISLTNDPSIPCNISYITQLQRTARSSIVLQDLSLSEAALSPNFDDKIKHYTATVGSDIGQLTVIPTANYSGQRITINGRLVTSRSSRVPLNIGNNTLTVVVTSADRKAATSYTLEVTRQMLYLTHLRLSAGQLNPGFNSQTTRYTTTVDSDVTQLRLDPTTNGNNNVINITVNDNSITNNVVPLDIGGNTITVSVSTPDGKATASYTLEVTRKMPYLTGLRLSAGQLNPSFNSQTIRYTTTVDSDVTQLRLDPTANSNNHVINITANGNSISHNIVPLNVGRNTITVSVITPDGKATASYTLEVTRKMPYLTDLRLSTGQLNPSFNSQTMRYATTVDSDVTQLRLDSTANSNNHVIKVTVTDTNNDPLEIITANSNSITHIVPLDIGNNTITVSVITADGKATTNYRIKVTRLEPCLTALSLSRGIISPNFTQPRAQCGDATAKYNANVANDVSQINVMAMANSNTHTITVNGSSNTMVTLNVGDNAVVITVITADGKGLQSYHLTIRRLSTAILSDITVTAETTAHELTLKPYFNLNTLSYAITINSTITGIHLRPNTNDGRMIRVRYTPQNGSAIDQLVGSGDTIAIAIAANSNVIYIDVTHGSAVEQYRLTVHSAIFVRTKVFLEGPLR